MKIICKGEYDVEVGANYSQRLTIRQENPRGPSYTDLVVIDSAEQAKALIAAIKDNAKRLGWGEV